MSKRIVSLALFFSFIFTSVIGRCFYVSTNKAYAVADSYNSITLDINKLYTNIYDRNNKLLNNNTTSLIAIIRPNEKDMSELHLLFNNDEVKKITAELTEGKPVIKPITRYAQTKHIKVVEAINENSEDMLCKHLINRNYGGLETTVSKEIGKSSINYSVDALGRILSGDKGKLINKNYDSKEGVKTSIDREIQQIVETSSEAIDKGAVVVMDTNSSQILASYSKGNDYINRAVSPYAVGSVFKLVVTACAIENGVYLNYDCKNNITVGDTTYHCQKNKAHGKQNMKKALANSCNCYFVNLALELGVDKLYTFTEQFEINNTCKVYNTYTLKQGHLLTREKLYSKGQLALIGFGQGELTDTPVHFASIVGALVNGGHYYSPTLELKKSSSKQVISPKTSEKMLKYMRYVVSNGTGKGADYNNNCAGKTATAQSGIYVDGREILNTWFAGVYPYNNPKYTIVIMCEDGKSGAEDCCPIFCTIVEKLEKM